MKRILIWNHYGCTTTRYVLERFREDGHGAIFADECQPAGAPRAAHVIQDFLEGEEDTLLVLCRDSLVIDLIALLAAAGDGTVAATAEVLDLPGWNPIKDDGKVMNEEEDFEALLKVMDKATLHEIARPKEATDEAKVD